MDQSQSAALLWGVCDLVGNVVPRASCQDVVLPLTVLRRLDCVLAPTKQDVLEDYTGNKQKFNNLDPVLLQASSLTFYNTSTYDFDRLLADAPNLAANLRGWIDGFSPNIREALEKFDFDNTIAKLDDAGLLFQVMERVNTVDLHPDKISNREMGALFDDLVRKLSEGRNGISGEYSTPGDVARLMVDLMLAGDEELIRSRGEVLTIYDPCCGTGGMLTTAKEHIVGVEGRAGINPEAEVRLYGQDINSWTVALCRSALYMKDPSSNDAENIRSGSTLSDDRHGGKHFDYLIANPPYGRNWKRDKAAVEREVSLGVSGRFPAGSPRTSDGQLLFVAQLLAHMRPASEGGARAAILTNSSALSFAGHGPDGQIRRWILENDWLEAIVALPEQLFLNTAIAAYIWVLSNRKPAKRQGKVQFIDAAGSWAPMRRRLGNKGREITADKAAVIVDAFKSSRSDTDFSQVFAGTDLEYRRVAIEIPTADDFDGDEIEIPVDQDPVSYLRQTLATVVPDVRVSAKQPQLQQGCRFDFTHFNLARSRRIAAELGLNEVPPWRAFEGVKMLSDRAGEYDDAPEAIYVPRVGTGPVYASASELPRSHHSYIQLQLRPGAAIDSRYLARYLDSPEGKAFRRSLAGGSTIASVTARTWKKTALFVPPIAVQREIRGLASRLQALRTEVATLEGDLWREPGARVVVSERLDQLRDEGRGYVDWIDSLPFPLASVLWAAHASAEGSHREVEHLDHFFEAAAEYTATVLLSAFCNHEELFEEERHKLIEVLGRFNLSVKESSFGTWVRIVERLAKRVRRSLNSEEESQLLLDACGLDSEEVLARLTSKTIVGLLNQTNLLRNRFRGHGGAKSDAQLREHSSILRDFVGDYREAVGDAWSAWPLVLIGKAGYTQGQFVCNTDWLVGPRTPFEKKEVTLNHPAEEGTLHHYDSRSRRALELLPLVRILASPQSAQNACYFYNRVDRDGVRFVSYHFDIESEVTRESPRTMDAIRLLTKA